MSKNPLPAGFSPASAANAAALGNVSGDTSSHASAFSHEPGKNPLGKGSRTFSGRIVKINKHIQRVFGQILHRQADLPADVLVTISKVDTAPKLRSAVVWLYINPLERGEEVLSLLGEQMYDLQGMFNREVRLQPLPRLTLRLDSGAAYAEHIDTLLKNI